MRIFRVLMISAVATLLVACSSTKKVNNDVVDNNTINTTVTDNINDQWLGSVLSTIGGWTTMKANGHFSIKGGGKSFSSAMQVRMVRDDVIYISIRPLLGIEAGRLIIKDDSLFVINKLQKLYLAEKVSLLTMGVPATVGMMQDMFLGRPHILGEGTLNASRRSLVKVVDSDSRYVIQPISQHKDFNYAFTYDSNSHIVSLDVKLTKGNDAYSMAYGDIQRTLAGNIAHSIDFNTDVKGKPLSLKLEYDRITWNETLDTSFSIPSSYKRQDARSLMGIFQQ